jgi:hypothetical protein
MERDSVEQLLARAFLYEDPAAYRAGVEDALRELSRRPDLPVEPQPTPLRAAVGDTA